MDIDIMNTRPSNTSSRDVHLTFLRTRFCCVCPWSLGAMRWTMMNSVRHIKFHIIFVSLCCVLLTPAQGFSNHLLHRLSHSSAHSTRRSRVRHNCPRKSTRTSEDAVPSTRQIAEVSFWGQERTCEEVKSHVTKTLNIPDSQVEVLSAEPPLVVIHGFVSIETCHTVMEAAIKTGNLKRSTMGEAQEESDDRTSSTVWLSEQHCTENDGARQALRLLAELTSRLSGLPCANMENLQVVKYLPGQEFAIHTDHLDSFNDLDCKGRLATCLIYLQEPKRGGETRFFEFDKDVPPRQGSAVFFWNTLERPGSPNYDAEMFLHADVRLRHAGLPVLKGEKWICNRWIHPLDLGNGVRGFNKPDIVIIKED